MTVIVTFDSNVSSIINLVNKRLNFKTKRWCSSGCKCDSIHSKDEKNSDVIYYDTPISMCKVSEYSMPANVKLHFIYIDFHTMNESLTRIMLNLKHLNDYILITKSENLNMGTYKLVPNNCSESLTAESVAVIIEACMNNNGSPVHPDVIIQTTHSRSKNNSVTFQPKLLSSQNDAVSVFDIVKFSENRYPSDVIEDCVLCV